MIAYVENTMAMEGFYINEKDKAGIRRIMNGETADDLIWEYLLSKGYARAQDGQA